MLLLGVGGWQSAPAQQQPPESGRPEVQEQGLSPAEARRRARQLGIDLSNPERAVQQARRRGVPEARIQALLRAVRGRGADAQPAVGQPTAGPALAGPVALRPDTIPLFELPRGAAVEVPLTSDTTVTGVDPFVVRGEGRGRDTLQATGMRQTRRAEAEQTWSGRLSLPADLEPKAYLLRVRVSTPVGTTVLPTSRYLVVRSDRARPDTARRDTARRDTLRYFGYETFESVPDAFQPSPTGPVDDRYIVGPGDELRLAVWGAPEFQYTLTVDRQGRVYVPNHGQFTAAGKRLSTLRKEMKKWLSKKHSGLTAEPQTVFMDLSVTRIQPIRIYVLGAVPQPGGYTVSAMSNAFNALYSVGGPLRRGSLRRIRVIRDGEVTDTVDLYDYLTDGASPDPVALQDGDYLRVPVRGKTVAITGAVERPAYYELKEGETVRDLIEYAGGLRPEAYTESIRVDRLVPPSERDSAQNASVPRKTLTFDLGAVMDGSETVSLADADRVHVRSIPEESDPASISNVASAQVSGAVFQPGEYAIGDSLRTVRDLIHAANGLTDDAYRAQATLVRINEDLGQAVRTINVDSAMAGIPRANVPLVAGDSLHISSVQNLEGRRTVRITGQVRNPGTYPYRTGMTVADLLLKGGGLADSTYLKNVLRSRADLYRESADGRSERVIPFNLARALSGNGFADRELRPGDEIRIYPLRAEVNTSEFVEIRGAVKKPGEYQFQENLALKDLILRANGFREDAYLKYVEVARPRSGGEGMRTLRVPMADSARSPSAVRFGTSDTTRVLGAAADFQLQHRDRVLVRTNPAYSERRFVTVRGEVRFPGDYALKRDGETLSSVLERAGGVPPSGYPGGGRLLRNGKRFVIDIAKVIQGQDDLSLQDGDEIVIPTDPNSVSVRGNVAREGIIKHQDGRDVEYYLRRAGGVRDSTKAVYLTQATGATFKVDRGLFSSSPTVTDGAVIRVTRKSPPPPDREGVDIGQVITDVTGILSSALTIIVLATRAFD
ncbi:MAG: SLBB domain-containing protein [Salinibacter sp.]|uniref:SLBB domain-containing protein n=1 Tax=Salinibacter sp. TaxID=2065818 RepID=UPI0035D47197